MTTAGIETVHLLVRVPLTVEDRDYIHQAFLERVAEARAKGEHIGFSDFVRDALLEAAHR